jgi:hypothetical protein
MSLIFATQLTAVATSALAVAVLAFATAILAGISLEAVTRSRASF